MADFLHGAHLEMTPLLYVLDLSSQHLFTLLVVAAAVVVVVNYFTDTGLLYSTTKREHVDRLVQSGSKRTSIGVTEPVAASASSSIGNVLSPPDSQNASP